MGNKNDELLSDEMFGDFGQYRNFSPFDVLAFVVGVAYEKETQKEREKISSNLRESKKRATLTDKNIKPSVKKPRTHTTVLRRTPIRLFTPQPEHVAPELFQEFRPVIVEMGGSLDETTLVLEKTLTATDVNKSHGRLSLPPNKITLKLTQDEEDQALSKDEKGNVIGFMVKVIDNNLCVRNLMFKKWPSLKTYNILCGWNELVSGNGLKEHDVVQIWSFRCGPHADLALAVVKINR